MNNVLIIQSRLCHISQRSERTYYYFNM